MMTGMSASAGSALSRGQYCPAVLPGITTSSVIAIGPGLHRQPEAGFARGGFDHAEPYLAQGTHQDVAGRGIVV
jgi:hypothetical protein